MMLTTEELDELETVWSVVHLAHSPVSASGALDVAPPPPSDASPSPDELDEEETVRVARHGARA